MKSTVKKDVVLGCGHKGNIDYSVCVPTEVQYAFESESHIIHLCYDCYYGIFYKDIIEFYGDKISFSSHRARFKDGDYCLVIKWSVGWTDDPERLLDEIGRWDRLSNKEVNVE